MRIERGDYGAAFLDMHESGYGPSAISAFVLLLSDEPTSGATTTKRLIYEYTP